MDKRPIVFLDSGIGSLPYYHHFAARNPAETVYCVADRANFPYGPRSREDICGLLDALAGRIVRRFNPKLLALACNAASVSGLAFLRERFPGLTIVGTVPAVKPAVEGSRTGQVGLLGTERAVTDPYAAALAARCDPRCVIRGEAAPGLVEFVERRYAAASPEERLQAARVWVEKFSAAGADAIVLGCTHFLILREEFLAAAKEAAARTGRDFGVYDSVGGITKRLEFFLDAEGGALRAGGEGSGTLLITGEGEIEERWRYWAGRFGLGLEVWP